MALSKYSVTIILCTEHKCKYHSIWQEDKEETKRSSGLCLVLSPQNAGSDEPEMSDLFSICI